LSRKKRKSRPRKQQQEPPKASRARKALNIVLPVLTVVVLALVAYLVFFSNKPSTYTPSSSSHAIAANSFDAPKYTRKAQTLNDLLDLPVEQLADVDIAEMNLLCAVGLPGAENLDIDHALATLDQWAQRVKFETERHLYRAHDPKWADHYRHSEAYLRAEFLLQVLQQDLGVKYDLTAKDNFDFDDSRVAFLHGMIPAKGQTVADTQGGTCASMPVMYVAIGRRLGYPLKLVTTNGHIFVRWDGRNHPNPAWRERFNIEGAGDGFSSFPDEYYKTWPFKLTDAQVKANRYLVSLTPAEEFAEFLAARGHCGLDNGEIAFAACCYENAYRYDTTRPAYRAWFLDAAMKSGYRPATPVLARMLAERINRIAAARRGRFDPMAMPKPSEMATMGTVPGLPHVRVGRSQPQIPQPHVPQIPQPGLAQPYQPPGPAQPPRP
jgi:hypothetical protein